MRSPNVAPRLCGRDFSLFFSATSSGGCLIPRTEIEMDEEIMQMPFKQILQLGNFLMHCLFVPFAWFVGIKTTRLP